jgi:hypothetical protein
VGKYQIGTYEVNSCRDMVSSYYLVKGDSLVASKSK